ncbi:uncharacterized protein [Panulirus ornatus]|uniref:uncharacterized protein n=1 Tax=Panulirus ornatus TaxID=150431 RepID=UPI003A83558B
MRLRWLLPMLVMAAAAAASLAQAHCRCGLFLVTSQTWRPEHLAFTTSQTYEVDCHDASQASVECRRHCEEEVLALNQVFATQPEILHEYNPLQDLPCGELPADTSSFYSVCGEEVWRPASAHLSSSVCCHPVSHTPVWCTSVEEEEEQQQQQEEQLEEEEQQEEGRSSASSQTVMQRKIDTDADQNDVHNNEIEDSTKAEASQEGGGSWITRILSFFGYKNIGDMLQNIDIFSIPGKIQAAMKTYSDEISMGQCYMEFTTYNIFSKQDGIFASFLRTRRDLTVDEGRPEEAEDLDLARDLEEEEELKTRIATMLEEGRATWRQGQTTSAIEKMAHGLVGMLEGSPTTRQYADVIKQLMPVVMKVYTSDDPSSAITTFISQALGPYLSQIQKSPPKNPNDLGSSSSKPGRWPSLSRPKPTAVPKTTPRPAASTPGGSSSPITTMVLEFLKYYMGNYLSSLPGNGTSRPRPSPTRPPVASPPASPPPPPASSPNIGNILSLLLGPSRPQKTSRPKPVVQKRPQKPQVLEKQDSKTFVEMVLEFIRPVFISIIGKAPGESGVASIREVTRLSSLGRVDDTVVEEVLSPYFCLKNYLVNKAWTLTERGVRSVVGKFNEEEQTRMMRMLQED